MAINSLNAASVLRLIASGSLLKARLNGSVLDIFIFAPPSGSKNRKMTNKGSSLNWSEEGMYSQTLAWLVTPFQVAGLKNKTARLLSLKGRGEKVGLKNT